MDRVLHPFPLLYHPSKYRPDTEDLTADEAAREYWLDCFESGLHMVSSFDFLFIVPNAYCLVLTIFLDVNALC